jgi:hypothetical protein
MIAESKGPIAEAAVSSTPGDKVSALGVDRRPVCPSSRFFAAFIDPSRWVCLSSSVFARQPAAPNSNALFRAVAFIVGFAAVMIAYHTILEGVAGTSSGWWLTEKRSCERIAPKWDYGARHSEIACA